MADLDLSGVLLPVPTPFDPVTGDVDLVGLRGNIRAWVEHPIRGIVIAGSTGEAVYLDEDERSAILRGAREVIPGDRLLLAGTGAESTRATIRLTEAAAEAGADAVLVQPPAFYLGAMTPPVLRDHYKVVADASPVPVVLYQVPPKNATVELSTGLVVELASHPNIVGIKDSRGDLDLLGELVEACPPGFQVLVGNGALLYGALEVGAVGGILGVGNLAPAEAVALHEAFVAGRTSEAGRLQERIGPVHKAIVGKLGVPGVKVALDALGLRGGPPRSPLRALSGDGEDEVRGILERARLI